MKNSFGNPTLRNIINMFVMYQENTRIKLATDTHLQPFPYNNSHTFAHSLMPLFWEESHRRSGFYSSHILI